MAIVLPTDFEQMLNQAYRSVGAFDANILYIYTDFRYFGNSATIYKNRNEFCNAIVAPFLDRGKTIILTTFTYTAEGRFDVLGSRTNLGAMNKWILEQIGAKRSEHPLFSYAAFGPEAGFIENIGKSAFGYDSVFARLQGKRAAFLHIGRPVSMGNTALHYVEHMCGATYRIHTAFRTEVFRGEHYIGTDYSAFLRRRDLPGENFEFDFSKATAKLYDKKLINQVGSDIELSNISFYWYDQTIDCLLDLFYKDPRVFIKSNFIGYKS
ncbi:AAC(3) family N-acetyltransferase [Leptospira noguchii]|uniref:AAC(3) family N-acetyltransferase n=1 Tax=Leptospira noguchii TaxID=28182 RepID=UPI001F0642A3|nr:AAC(3) family N-acetyltransferase [Leptospira noguchii]MCH1913318.1 AAC(3) family N-acetyltransferase [Leptospira noguchii]MCH1915419.1 AAC(3) family N-acetyltransferase [Leptospira noguchii]UOG65268.1 AAC(3) family N-acetyltransferase [Leptospira noguchii]